MIPFKNFTNYNENFVLNTETYKNYFVLNIYSVITVTVIMAN